MGYSNIVKSVFNLLVFDEINTGYISYHTFLQFMDAEGSQLDSELSWLSVLCPLKAI